MPEISQFISPEAIKQQADYLAKMKAIKESYVAATKESLLLLQTVDKLNVSSKNTSEVQKKLNESVDKATKVNKDLKNIEIEREKVQQNLRNALSKNLVLQEKSGKILAKARLQTQQLSKENKQNAIITKSLSGSYEKINASLNKNIASWKKLSEAERNNSKTGKQLLSTIKSQDAALKKLDSQMGRSQRHVGNYMGAIKRVAMQFAGALGLTSVVFMFINVLKGSFNTIREFTKQNAVLAGVLGKTRKEITQLTDQAIQLGSVYPVTASEVNKLQVSFARLGFTQQEIISLTEATILGSIALNAELDATATLVGAVVKAYANLGTSDAQLIIDQLTLSTQRSSLSFVSLETALPKVASAASAMNIPLSKTLALLGMAHDATLDASISGTSLRNIFLVLAAEGITLEDALTRINNSSNRLTASYDLFGKRGAIVGLTLADNIDKIDEFTAAIYDAGGVSESVAKEQMATLDGSIKGLGSSWEKFVLGFKGSEGVLRIVIDSLALTIDTFSNDSISSLRKLIEFISIGIIPAASKIQKRLDAVSKNITNASVRDLEYTIKINGEKLKNGSKTDRLILDMLKNRLQKQKIIDIAANRDAEERAKIALRRAKLEKVALVDEAADEIAESRRKSEEKAVDEFLKMNSESNKRIRKQNKKETEEFLKESNKLEIDELENLNNKKEALAHFALQDEIDARKEANKKKLEDDQEYADQQIQIAEDVKNAKNDLAIAGVDALFELNSMKFDRQLNDLEKEREAALSNENLTREEKAKIEEEYDKKAAKIKEKQAKNDKIAALFNVAVNTAVAVTKATASLMLPLIPWIIGQGVVQAALIASQPIPAFAKGTDDAPMQGLFGEKGAELMRTVAGELMYADKATVFSGQEFKGAKIWNAGETKEIMSGMSNGIVKGKDIDALINISLAKRYEKGFSEMANEYRNGTKQIVSALNKKQSSYNPRAKKLTERNGNTIKHYYDVFK